MCDRFARLIALGGMILLRILAGGLDDPPSSTALADGFDDPPWSAAASRKRGTGTPEASALRLIGLTKKPLPPYILAGGVQKCKLHFFWGVGPLLNVSWGTPKVSDFLFFRPPSESINVESDRRKRCISRSFWYGFGSVSRGANGGVFWSCTCICWSWACCCNSACTC